MNLKLQKRLAASILGCSSKRVVFDSEELSTIKEGITKADIKGLISGGTIKKKPVVGVSRGRAKLRHAQRKKGRQRGAGRKKGTVNARNPRKEVWMAKIRLQRNMLKSLKITEKITSETYRALYLKAKGGFFRSKRHIDLYLTENKLLVLKNKK